MILMVTGSLGIFLYGMILMSESLQKVAGKRIRNVLATFTARHSRSILTGTLVTGAIQSSSATTVMVVSFVNAGLLTLMESFGIIMGANIGTTITPWLISLLGFGKAFDIISIILPLVALSLPLLFSRRSNQRSWAEFIIGLAILFLGLQMLKEITPMLDVSSPFIEYIKQLDHHNFYSVLLFVGIGLLLTVIFQSSSAVMALTFVLAVDGFIPFELAAAMVLGENIGTTVTANAASIVANIRAKQAAFFHFLFNFAGVAWALAFFYPIMHGIAFLTGITEEHDPRMQPMSIPFALALFHTGFNIANTLLFIYFLPFLSRFIPEIIKTRHEDKVLFRLKHIDSSYLSTSELSLVQAKKEIVNYSSLVLKMYDMIPEVLMEKRSKKYARLIDKIKKYEKITDNIELEIAAYLTRVSEGKLSQKTTRQLNAMLKMIDDIESMGDSCHKMGKNIEDKNRQHLYFIQEQRDSFYKMYHLVRSALVHMIHNLENDYALADLEKAQALEKEINMLRDTLRSEHVENLNNEKYSYKTGIHYIDLIAQMEKVGDYAINVTESIYESL